MRKPIRAIVAMGVVVTTVVFVRQREAVIKKMSGTQSRESDDVALPGVVRRLYVWAWEWVQKGKPLATTKRLPWGALGSESNLRVKA